MTNLPDLNNVEETMAYLQGLDPEQKERIIASVEPYLEKVWLPQPGPQADAFYHEADELLYGGAAGGGKSDLIAGLCTTAHHRSLVFRMQSVDLDDLWTRIG